MIGIIYPFLPEKNQVRLKSTYCSFEGESTQSKIEFDTNQNVIFTCNRHVKEKDHVHRIFEQWLKEFLNMCNGI